MTICVPCFERHGKEVPAMRFVPTKNGNVPMCEDCWGGGMGPGMDWKPKPKAQSPTVDDLLKKHHAEGPVKQPESTPKPKGRLTEIAEREEPPKETSVLRTCTFCGKPKHRGRCKERNKAFERFVPPEAPKPKGKSRDHLAAMLEKLEWERAEIDKKILAIKTVQGLFNEG